MKIQKDGAIFKMKLTKSKLKEIIREEILAERYLNLKSIKHSDKKIAGYMKQFQKLDDILQKIDMIDFTSHLGKEGHNKAKGAGNKILDLKRSLYDELKNLDKNLNEGKITEKEREPSYENRNLTDLLRNMTTTLSLFETMIHRGTGRDEVSKFIRKRVSPQLTKLVKELKKV